MTFQNKKLTHALYTSIKIGPHKRRPIFVEAVGIEPTSSGISTRASTSVDYVCYSLPASPQSG